jgi:hypothetical protein
MSHSLFFRGSGAVLLPCQISSTCRPRGPKRQLSAAVVLHTTNYSCVHASVSHAKMPKASHNFSQTSYGQGCTLGLRRQPCVLWSRPHETSPSLSLFPQLQKSRLPGLSGPCRTAETRHEQRQPISNDAKIFTDISLSPLVPPRSPQAKQAMVTYHAVVTSLSSRGPLSLAIQFPASTYVSVRLVAPLLDRSR